MRRALLMLTVAVAATPAAGQESLPREAVAAIKAATVLITTTAGADRSSGGTGSGFLIRVEGETAYVATNNHVVSARNRLAGEQVSVTVVIRCGTKAERKLPAEIVAASPESDLAILRIKGLPDSPAPRPCSSTFSASRSAQRSPPGAAILPSWSAREASPVSGSMLTAGSRWF
jgi:S1-C subfamily serine protease